MDMRSLDLYKDGLMVAQPQARMQLRYSDIYVKSQLQDSQPIINW